MDGELSEGWRKVLVGAVARVETGGTPARSKPENWGGDIRWMSSGEVKAKRVSETAERITEEGLRSSNAKVFAPGTVMVAMNGQGRTRGSVAYLDVGASCNQSLAAITPGEGLSSRFLYQNLDTRYDELRALTGDDARSGLNLHLIRSLPLLLPPLTEQCSIAWVLDAIDEAIEKTEAVIAATEDLRKALLQELLTRGVPGWHTEWKMVPGIGTIPACWDVVRLGDVAEVASGIALGPARRPAKNPVRYLTVANVQADRIDIGTPRFMELQRKRDGQ
jgi:type I restriction enzyme S subunit